jgi:hypothetical protein
MMRTTRLFTTLTAALLISVAASATGALELTTLYHLGNLSFDRSSESAETSLSGLEYPWGLSIYGNHEISDQLSLTAGFFYDPVLRNSTYTLFEYADEFFRIGVGPFFGVFNSTSSILKSGISTSVQVEFPGCSSPPCALTAPSPPASPRPGTTCRNATRSPLATTSPTPYAPSI